MDEPLRLLSPKKERKEEEGEEEEEEKGGPGGEEKQTEKKEEEEKEKEKRGRIRRKMRQSRWEPPLTPRRLLHIWDARGGKCICGGASERFFLVVL